uniref:HECT-type E3 ubiquitin transferase n=1 Tax=Trichuris muris TaxID=70415 RepID=A0A5S6QY85_TRIMR
MKIDRSKVAKKVNHMSCECKAAVDRILSCDRANLGHVLASLSPWKFGKVNFNDWVDVFDLFDEILAQQTERVNETEWTLKIDKATQKEVSSVCEIVQFSGTLLEHCRGIALYNSFERMTALLESDNLSIVSAALGVLLVCSRRGGFQTHLARAQQDEIVNRLSFMAKAWPAYEYGLTLPLYCSKNAEIPAIATTVSFEVELDENGKWPSKKSSSGFVNRRTLVFENVHRESGVSLLTNKVMGMYSNMPRDVLFELQHKLRLAHSLGDASLRLESVVVRLRSLASVVYWVLLKEYAEFLQPTFYEECFDLLKLPDASALFAVKAEVLKTLATVIQYERNAIMQKIIAASGANYYHGFLPSLTRACVKQLMDKNRKKESNFPPDFILSLLSFLYYYTGYQLGAQSLAQNGILEVLFMLVRSNLTSGCATYITRAVRVIDSASQFDIQVFQSMDGMFIFIHRLSVEIERCRKDLRQEQCVFDVELDINDGTDTVDDSTMEVATEQQQSLPTANVGIQTDEAANLSGELSFSRKSLIRCLISFIKKIIPDLQFSETVRHLMDGNFYNCVKHIIENRDYYGISLFLLAVHTVSTFIMQEPSQLSVLQSRGLTATIFQKLLCDELPASRELFVLLPTIYSALCLNDTGVAEFLKYGSFAKTFGVLVQAKYVQVLRRRVSDANLATVCEAAASLGAGMDMLVRQQPRLRGPCISQFLGVLVKLDSLCRDPAYKCSTKETPRTTKPKQKETAPRRMRVPAGRGNTHNDDAFGSDETDPSEDEESRSTEMTRENSGAAVDRFGDSVAAAAPKKAALVEESEESKRLPLPLVDYVHNVLRFSDALMSNQSVDEFSKMFVDRNGVTKFFRIFTGPNLPPLCYNQKLISQAAAVFRSVFGYTRNCAIVKEFINEMKSCCLVGTAELLHSSWEMQADSSALMDAFLSDTDIVETENGVTFFRPLENLLFFVSVWNEFLKNFGGVSSNDWRVGLLREILGSGLVHMLGLIWRALAWEDIRIRAVHLPKSEGKAAADVAQGSAVGAAAQETTQPRGTSIGQTVHHPNGVIGQLLILTEGLTNQIRRAFAYIVGLASGSPQRNRRMFSYGRSHPPAYGDPLLLSVIFSVHQSLIRSFSARHTAVPRMWASFMLANIQALQGTLFEDSKRALHPILEKLHTSGLFVTFLRCLVKLVDDDCVWEQKFITSAGPDFKRFLEESLWLIENLLSAVSSPENEDTLDQPTTSFVQSFTKCTSDLLYPLMMGLWKRVMRNHSILSFLLDPLLSLICQATQREHDRLRQKGAGSNEQAASDQRVVRNEMERFVDRSNYERLLDMGFPRELAIDALLTYSSVEQATEFCLAASANSRRSNEERANNTTVTPPSQQTVAANSTAVVNFTSGERENVAPSPRDAFLSFARQIGHLYSLLELLDVYPALVYRTADLVSVTVKLCGFVAIQPFFALLLGKIVLKEKSIASNLVDTGSDVSKEGYQHLCIGDLAQSLSVHLHLLSLLLHEFGAPLAHLFFFDPEALLSKLFGLTEYAVCYFLKYVTLVDCTAALPKWLTPFLVSLDLYEAAVIEVKRIARIPKCHSLLWQYFDRKWIPHHLWVMRMINSAYQDGETSLRLTINRRRVVIDFSKMTQNNLDSGIHRRVMFHPVPIGEGDKEDDSKRPFPFPALRHVSDENFVLPPLDASYHSRIMKICADLICPQTDPDCLQAVLRLCLRYTRDHSLALMFISSGGVEKLLELRTSQFFNEFTVIVTLIVRHLLEDAPVLDYLMEKAIRDGLNNANVNNNVSWMRDFNYMLRSFEHIACRDLDTFVKVVCRVIRLKASLPSTYERDNPNGLARCPFLNIRCEPRDETQKCPPLGHTSQTVLSALLNYLTRDLEAIGANESEVTTAEGKPATAGQMDNTGDPIASTEGNAPPAPSGQDNDGQTSPSLPSISKSSVLALLAELIHNYPEVPEFFVSYRYPADLVQRSNETKQRSSLQTEPLCSQSCSALAYILDNLLVEELVPNDKDCGAAVKLVIASLASSTQNEEVLSMLVTEVKLALLRALTLTTKCLYKHKRIVAIVSLVTVMKNACPWYDGNSPNRDQNGNRANSVVRWIQKKRLLTDLANVPHYLNLSDPNTITTMNAVLKAMEDIARFVLCPVNAGRSSTQNRTGGDSRGAQQGQQRQLRQANSHRHRHGSSMRQGQVSSNFQDVSFLPNLLMARISVSPISEDGADRSAWNGEQGHPDSANGSRPPDGNNNADGPNDRSLDTSFGRADDMGAMSQDNEDGSAMDISSQEGDMLDDEEVLMVEEEDGQRSTSVTEGEEEEDEEEEDVENDDEEEEDEEDDDEDEEYEEEEEVENEDGHEGSDREEEESEYEDMGRNFEEGLRISMQELAQGADDFDVTLEDDGTFSRLTEALRRALVPQSNHPRSSRELVFPAGNSMGFTIPDVEQFLAAGSRSLGLSNAASNVPIGVAHPILLRQPEQQDSNSVGTVSGPGVTHRQLMVVRSTNNWNRGFTSGGYPHGSYRTSILTRRLNPRFRQPRDVFSLVEASLQSHGRMVPYLDFGEASLHSDLPNSTHAWEDVDDSVDVTNVIHSSCISWEFESRLLDANYCNIITAAVRTPILDVLHGYYDEEMKALREQEAKAKEAASQQKQQQDADQSQPTANAIGNVQDEPETADMAVENTANVSDMNAEQQQQQQQQPDEAGETEAQGATLNNGAPYVPMDETLQVESTPEQPQGGEATASADAAIINPPVPTTQVQSDASLVVVEPASVHSELEMPANEGEGNEAAQAEVVVIHQPDVITVDIVSGPPPPLPPLNPTGLNRVTDPRLRAILGDVELPEGIDPNFLAELPENIREEVISDQLQLLRAQQQSRQAVQRREGTAENSAGENALDSDISYEFLVALPPELQDEVVAQHRLSRHQAQQQQEAPDAPVDLAAFFDTLPRTLREQVLADADDSQIALLPSHIAEEARRLRASTGARDPYHMSVVNSLRQYGVISRFDISRRSAGLRTTLRRHGGRIAGYRRNGTPLFIDSPSEDIYTPSSPPPRIAFGMRCSPLLDKESLSCLIVLFFCHNPGLNATRLHRLFKNLCYEAGTRDWLIRTFLSILDRTYRSATEGAVPKVDWASLEASSGQPTLPDRQGGHSKAPNEIAINTLDLHLQKWLNVVVKSSMGAHIEVFQVRQQRTPGRRSSSMASMNINPLFLPALCCQMIASLTSLAKIFPAAFFPDYSHSEGSAEEGKKTAQKASSSAGPSRRRNDSNDGKQATTTDFWDILVKLDATSIVGKPEGFSKPIPPRHVPSFGYPESVEYASLEEAPFGQLMLMINHPVIAERPYIMNHFLRLLATVANAMDSAKLASIVNRDGGENVFLEDQLKLLIDMHTRCKNGDDSRGDSDSLLTRCAMNLGLATQRRIFDLLVNAAVELAETLSDEIAELMRDLEQEDEHIPSTSTGIPPASSFIRPGIKGTMVDRFTGSTVIVSGGVPHRAACPVSTKELHCASIGKMNEKNSTQVCLLRTATLFLKLKGRVLDVRQPGLNNEQTPSELRGNSREQQDVATDVTVNEQPAAAAAAAPSTSHESKKDAPGQSVTKEELEALCTKLKDNKLWELLSTCLSRLALSSDPHTVLVLQPAVEAFFILHADNKDEMMQLSSLLQSGKPEGEQSSLAAGMDVGQSPTPLDVSTASMSEVSVFSNPGYQKLNPDVQKFVRFAEKHRTVLNQILRQTKVPLNSGPFSVLVNYTRILDFDIKRKYFRRELEFMEHGYRGEDIAVRVKRDRIFQNSFRELCRLRSEQWKGRFYIMFEGEEGQDAGGLLREWFSVITREIFNPNYALFMTSPGDRVTYMINPASYVNKNHLEYFHFIGRLIAKAVFDNKYLDCYFTRAFYKHILGKPVKYTDIESEDPSFYQSLFYLLENPVSQLGYDVTFSLEVEEFGVRDLRDLKENGRHTLVTDQNKQEYVNLVCQMKMTGAIRQQLNAFLNGFYDIIPKDLISIFNEQELELLISGLPIIDVDDLQQNTEYHKYTKSSVQIQWFWRAVRSFDHADRAKLLQFVTGTSRVPLQGFGSLQGMHGVQRFQIHRDDRSVDRLPTAHTCFNQLDLPPYESYEKLRQMLLLAIRECSEGFGFA